MNWDAKNAGLLLLTIAGLFGLAWLTQEKVATKKRVFLSFDSDDKQQVNGLRLLTANPDFDIEFYDESLKVAIDSKDAAYIQRVIREKITRASITVCLVGDNTYQSAWVDWELRESDAQKMKLIGMALKGHDAVVTPPHLKAKGVTVWKWDYQYLAKLINA